MQSCVKGQRLKKTVNPTYKSNQSIPRIYKYIGTSMAAIEKHYVQALQLLVALNTTVVSLFHIGRERGGELYQYLLFIKNCSLKHEWLQ